MTNMLQNGIPAPTLVNQVNDRTCGHACLAMVTGRAVDEVIGIVGDEPLDTFEERMFLAMHGILTVDVPMHAPFTWGVYMASAPSMNLPPKMHRVVVYTEPGAKGDPWVVLDPQTDRPGRKWYTEFNGDVMAYAEMTLLVRPANVDIKRYLRGAVGTGAVDES